VASLLARVNLAKRPGSLDLGCWTHVASRPFRADYEQAFHNPVREGPTIRELIGVPRVGQVYITAQLRN
jgi:hypothetical protein